MKIFVALLTGLLPATSAAAQDMAKQLAFQVEAPEGTPVATATAFWGDETSTRLLLPSDVFADNLCIRLHSNSLCLPAQLASPASPNGFPEFLVITVPIVPDDYMTRIQEIGIDDFFLAAHEWTPDAIPAEVSFVSQSPFGRLTSSVQPIQVVSATEDGFVIQGAGIGPLSVGAPIEHADLGIVGVIAEAQDGIARVITFARLTSALARSGFEVVPDLLPDSATAGALPREILGETGTGWLFTDYSPSLGYAGIYYGPGANPSINSLDYSTEFELQIFALSEDASVATLLTSGRAVSSMKDGVSLNAPYDRPIPQLAATCVLHETPSSAGRRVFVINIYRATPGSQDPINGTWSFDGVGANLSGFEESSTTCLDQLNALTPEQRAALIGETVTGDEARETPALQEGQPDPAAMSPTDSDIAAWEGTGNPALSMSAMGDLQLLLSCTDSLELVIAMQGGSGAEQIVLDGQTSQDAGVSGLFRYSYFPIPIAGPGVIQIIGENGSELETISLTSLPTGCEQ